MRVIVAVVACLATGAAAHGQALQVVPVANAGVMLRCGERAVLVDALFRGGVEGYEVTDPATREAMETGAVPYEGVRLVLATHRHADHFDAAAVARHLASNPRAAFLGTTQTAGAVAAIDTARARVVEAGVEHAFDGGSVTLVAVPHNAPHRQTIENSALLVRFCGKHVFFSGDAEVAPADFAAVAARRPRIDVAVVPWWFLTSQSGRAIVDGVLKPAELWAVHGDLDNPRGWMGRVREHYPDARIGFGGAKAAR